MPRWKPWLVQLKLQNDPGFQAFCLSLALLTKQAIPLGLFLLSFSLPKAFTFIVLLGLCAFTIWRLVEGRLYANNRILESGGLARETCLPIWQICAGLPLILALLLAANWAIWCADKLLSLILLWASPLLLLTAALHLLVDPYLS